MLDIEPDTDHRKREHEHGADVHDNGEHINNIPPRVVDGMNYPHQRGVLLGFLRVESRVWIAALAASDFMN